MGSWGVSLLKSMQNTDPKTNFLKGEHEFLTEGILFSVEKNPSKNDLDCQRYSIRIVLQL